MIHIRAGPELHMYTVQKSVLYHWSPNFKEVFASESTWFGEDIVEIPQIPSKVMALVHRWLHYQILLDDFLMKDDQNLAIFVDLYIVADKMKIPSLKNDTIIALDRCVLYHNLLPLSRLSDLWTNTPRGCKMQQYMVDKVVWFSLYTTFHEQPDLFRNHEACIDIMAAMRRKIYLPPTANPLLNLGNYFE
jgi:hypothetical protein